MSEPKRAEKPTHWSVFVVGVFSALLLLVAGVGATDIRPEVTFKSELKGEKSVIPANANKEHLLNLLRSKLSWTTKEEREPVLRYIEGLSEKNISEEERQRIEKQVESIAQGAMSNLIMVPVLALLGMVGATYVVYQLL